MAAVLPAGAGNWTWHLPQGSAAEWDITLTQATPPYQALAIGTAWEYVVNNTSGVQQFKLTPTGASVGTLTVSTASATLTMQVNPVATASLATGAYPAALWQDPATTSAACWLTGTLIIDAAPQP